MKYVLIIHEVKDYAQWKSGFDAAEELRKNAGEISFQVLRYEHAANQIVHFSQWQSLDAAKAFFESDEVAKIRKDLGVKAPEFIYLDQLEAGVL